MVSNKWCKSRDIDRTSIVAVSHSATAQRAVDVEDDCAALTYMCMTWTARASLASRATSRQARRIVIS
jgi:hypothetical protein